MTKVTRISAKKCGMVVASITCEKKEDADWYEKKYKSLGYEVEREEIDEIL
jgi:hypothetical protein